MNRVLIMVTVVALTLSVIKASVIPDRATHYTRLFENTDKKPLTRGVEDTSTYIHESSSNSYGSFTIVHGAKSAFLDVDSRELLGWSILGCVPAGHGVSTSGTLFRLRLVCEDDEGRCSQPSEDEMEDKVIYAPSCGGYPFARIVTTHMNQKIGFSTESKYAQTLSSRGAAIHDLILDTNFSNPSMKNGRIDFLVVGATSGDRTQALATLSSLLMNTSMPFHGASELITLSKNYSSLPPLHWQGAQALLNETLACDADGWQGTEAASIILNVGASVDANLKLGFTASGSLIPPSLNQLSSLVDLSLNLTGILGISSDVIGEIDSSAFTLVSELLGELDVPGILSILPSFDVKIRSLATLGAKIDLNTSITHAVENIRYSFTYPELAYNTSESPKLTLTQSNTSLSFAEMLAGNSTISTFIYPAFHFNISVLSGSVTAQLTAGLGASSTFSLGLQGDSDSNPTSWLSNDDADLCSSLSASLTDYFNASIALPLPVGDIRGSANSEPLTEARDYGETLSNVTLFEKCLSYNLTSPPKAAKADIEKRSSTEREIIGQAVSRGNSTSEPHMILGCAASSMSVT